MKPKITYKVSGINEKGRLLNSPWFDDYEDACICYRVIFDDYTNKKIIKRTETFEEVTP